MKLRNIECPSPETRSWKRTVVSGVEGYLAPDGTVYVPARGDEVAEIMVRFVTRGLPPLFLVRADQSGTVTRAARAERRQQRELRKRGLA